MGNRNGVQGYIQAVALGSRHGTGKGARLYGERIRRAVFQDVEFTAITEIEPAAGELAAQFMMKRSMNRGIAVVPLNRVERLRRICGRGCSSGARVWVESLRSVVA